MENKMPSWQSLLLKQPLAESFWVFNNPVKILQWILPSSSELKEFSSLLCLSAHFLDALLAEYLLHRTFNSSVPFCAPMHLLNALLAELSESSVILFPSS
jgi:hypothetical protein